MSKQAISIFVKTLLIIIGVIILLLGVYTLWAYISWSSQTEFNVEGRLGNMDVPNDTLKIMCSKGEIDIKKPASIEHLDILLPQIVETCGKNANAMLLFGTEKKAYDVLFRTSSTFSSDPEYYFIYLQDLIPENQRADLTVLVYKSQDFEEVYREIIPDAHSFISDAEDSITFRDYTEDGKTDVFVSAPVTNDWGWRVFLLKPDGSLVVWKTMSADASYGYSIREGVPYFRNAPIAGADRTSFQILGLTNFAKDRNKVYYGGSEATGYDVATLVSLDGDYAYIKDKNGVYYRFPYSDGWEGIPYDKLEGADPETFEMIEGGYSKDKNRVYNNTRIIEGADPTTFEVITDDPDKSFHWSKDNKHVFSLGRIVEGANPQTFKALSYMLGADGVHVFSGRYLIEEADPATFEVIDEKWPLFAKDKNHVYIPAYNEENPTIEGADPTTFELLTDNYSRDKNHIFIYTRILPEADQATFDVLENGYATDKNHVYLDGEVREGVDPATFSLEN